jgi:hypothetical protein
MMFCGTFGLFGGLFSDVAPFNILIIASFDCGFALAFTAVALVAFFWVAFLAVVFFGLAMIFSFWFVSC